MSARKTERQNSRCEYECSGSPKTSLKSGKLEHNAGEERAEKTPASVGHVVEPDIQRDAIFVGVGQHQIGMDRRVDRKNHREDGEADYECERQD